MKYAAALLLAVGLAGIAPSAQSARPANPPAEKPKLVVLISIDQMRGDYVDRFRHQWSKGLNRLVTEGAWFRQSDYPYYNTVTCAGHASMSTGTVPAVHGMVLNQWWQRNNSRLVACTDDEDAKLITYGIPVSEHRQQREVPDVEHARRRDAAAGLAGAEGRQHLAQGALGDHARRPPAGCGDLARRGGRRMGHLDSLRQGADAVLCRLHRQASAEERDGAEVGAVDRRRTSISTTTRRRIAAASRW